MSGPLDALNLEHWWKAVAAAGLALAIAGAAANHNPLLVIGLGVLACGIGEWINRPMQQTLFQQGVGGLNGIVSGHRWKANPLGIILDIVGLALIAFGIWRIAFPVSTI